MTLYLEQYLDNLQALPGELQRKLRLLRELDQKAQSHMNQGDRLTNSFLAAGATMSTGERKKRYEEIQQHYSKAKSFGDEKVTLAMQTYEMVDKHIRRLDADLARFESELKKNLMPKPQDDVGGGIVPTYNEGGVVGSEKKVKKFDPDKDKKKRKDEDMSPKSLKKKKKIDDVTNVIKMENLTPKQEGKHLASLSGVGLMQQLAGIGADVLDMPIDPNEPVYCVCRQVSYGEMIGCDNADCPIEWFHFNCVGLSSKPKGKWFCPRCTDEKKKQKN